MEKPQIVVVDDENDILELYISALSDNFDVMAFNEPEAFLSSLEKKTIPTPNLVITDFKMPNISGLDMIVKAQSLGHHFPFILLSGYLSKEVAIEAIDVGAFRLLEKPTDFEDLISTIDQLLVEHDIYNVRREIRQLTSQLRELYSAIRIVLLQHIPEDVLNRLIVGTDTHGQVQEKISFEILLERLETRLDQLLTSEKIMTELKSNKFKS